MKYVGGSLFSCYYYFMNIPILSTKLYIPLPRTNVVLRPRLIERLNEGLDRKLTLISASAGFGKTTLVSQWVAACERPVAWLSLDEGDDDSTRFLTHFVAALQTIVENIGEGVFSSLKSSQPPSTESILTVLLNEISALPYKFVLVLDDYHVIDSKRIDDALIFLLKHLPPQMHLVITTRENPQFPLGRLRAQGSLDRIACHRPALYSRRSGHVPQSVDGSWVSRPTKLLFWRPVPKAGLLGSNWQHSRCRGARTFLRSFGHSLETIGTFWTIWSKRSCSVSPTMSGASYFGPPFSTGCMARCAMPSPARMMATCGWRPLSEATSLSFHWMTGATGIAIITSLLTFSLRI